VEERVGGLLQNPRTLAILMRGKVVHDDSSPSEFTGGILGNGFGRP